jgi:hypothetical protein
MEKKQSIRDEHDRAEANMIFDWKEKRRLAEEANKIQAAQFTAAQQQSDLLASQQLKRNFGHKSNNTSRAPFKKSRKEPMFNYLRGPPPGC